MIFQPFFVFVLGSGCFLLPSECRSEMWRKNVQDVVSKMVLKLNREDD
jgi:hypothetical protein